MKNSILILLISVLFCSCKQSTIPFGNNYYFQNPQPINDSELTQIPSKFLGNYIDSDSTKLTFTENAIFQETNDRFRFYKTDLDSLKNEFDIVNGKYVSKDSKEVFEMRKIGDSIEFYNSYTDTLFKFSDLQKAKRINGNLILSQKDAINWKIKLISIRKNKLIINQLYSDTDLKSMDSITKIHSKKIDSTSYIISPSRDEFRKFLKLKKLGYDQEFIKLSK